MSLSEISHELAQSQQIDEEELYATTKDVEIHPGLRLRQENRDDVYAVPAVEDQPPSKKQKRILVVDDESFNIMAVTGLMRVVGFTRPDLVDVGYNGEEAVDFVKTAIAEGEPDRYALIVTDCSMPFMDGYEATSRMRRLVSAARDIEGLSEENRGEEQMKIFAVTGHVE